MIRTKRKADVTKVRGCDTTQENLLHDSNANITPKETKSKKLAQGGTKGRGQTSPKSADTKGNSSSNREREKTQR